MNKYHAIPVRRWVPIAEAPPVPYATTDRDQIRVEMRVAYPGQKPEMMALVWRMEATVRRSPLTLSEQRSLALRRRWRDKGVHGRTKRDRNAVGVFL